MPANRKNGRARQSPAATADRVKKYSCGSPAPYRYSHGKIHSAPPTLEHLAHYFRTVYGPTDPAVETTAGNNPDLAACRRAPQGIGYTAYADFGKDSPASHHQAHNIADSCAPFPALRCS